MLVALEIFFLDSSSHTYYGSYNYFLPSNLLDYNDLLSAAYIGLFYMFSVLLDAHLWQSAMYLLFPYLLLSAPTCNALLISFKFLLCMSILMFVSGGMPSFSFDYLTKLGWIRFLSMIVLSFLVEIMLMSIM